MTNEVHIRPPEPHELPALQDIERSAGRWFRDVDMPEIADDDPFSIDQLMGYLRAGHAWAAIGATGEPVAYLLAEPVDGNLHIEQVSVRADHARRALGRRLLEHCARRAATDGAAALTLTTFLHVPWNAPYYLRCGFRILDERELTPGLVTIRRREAEHGMDRWPRVCMRRDI